MNLNYPVGDILIDKSCVLIGTVDRQIDLDIQIACGVVIIIRSGYI